MFEKLKELIAGALKIKSSDINDDFSLKTGRFKTSAGSVILGNIVRKVSGQQVDCRNVNTFGELTALLNAETSSASDAPNTEEIKAPKTDEETATPKSEEQNVSVSGHLVCGVDIQEIEVFPDVTDYWTEPFYTDNFTSDEIAYCVTAASPRHSFAARWCAKEALHKCGDKYLNIPLCDIQISKRLNGTLKIEVKADNEWSELGLSCSISHADKYAIGMVTGFEA